MELWFSECHAPDSLDMVAFQNDVAMCTCGKRRFGGAIAAHVNLPPAISANRAAAHGNTCGGGGGNGRDG